MNGSNRLGPLPSKTAIDKIIGQEYRETLEFSGIRFRNINWLTEAQSIWKIYFGGDGFSRAHTETLATSLIGELATKRLEKHGFVLVDSAAVEIVGDLKENLVYGNPTEYGLQKGWVERAGKDESGTPIYHLTAIGIQYSKGQFDK